MGSLVLEILIHGLAELGHYVGIYRFARFMPLLDVNMAVVKAAAAQGVAVTCPKA